VEVGLEDFWEKLLVTMLGDWAGGRDCIYLVGFRLAFAT
jgi:hypothetical protein